MKQLNRPELHPWRTYLALAPWAKAGNPLY
jgi:hypothetical protein